MRYKNALNQYYYVNSIEAYSLINIWLGTCVHVGETYAGLSIYFV